jgi:anti-sigma factor RsiW
MNCNTTIESFPWFLNGTVDPEEATRIREHLKECSACRGDLQDTHFAWLVFGAHPGPEDLTALALELDELPGERKALLEAHLGSCDTCREEWRMLQESRQAFLDADVSSEVTRDEAPTGVRPATLSRSPANDNRPGGLWRFAAIAATIVAVVTAAGWVGTLRQQSALSADLAAARSAVTTGEQLRAQEQAQRQQAEAQRHAAEERIAALENQVADASSPTPPVAQFNVPVVDVYPMDMVLRGGGPDSTAAEEIELPAVGDRVLLILGSQTDGDGPFTLEILDGDRVTWKGEGLRRQARGEFTLTLPRSLLPAGAFSLRVLDPAGREVERYRLRLTWG